MADGIDNETFMKAACIQAAAAVMAGTVRSDDLTIVERAKGIFDQMEKQKFFPAPSTPVL